MADPLLRVEGLEVFYGPIQILFGTSLQLQPGEALALLGTNGAGKSTLLKAIAGLLTAANGTIHHRGDNITGHRAQTRVARGIGMVSGGQAVFPVLSVADNLRVGAFSLGRDSATIRTRTDAVLDLFPQLQPLLKRPAGLLSGGEQQMLAIAKVLLLDPELLLIDELSLGLAPVVVGQLIDVVERLRRDGKTIVVVEQSLNVALHLAERAIFMEKGRVRFEGPTHELQHRDDIARAVFLGGR